MCDYLVPGRVAPRMKGWSRGSTLLSSRDAASASVRATITVWKTILSGGGVQVWRKRAKKNRCGGVRVKANVQFSGLQQIHHLSLREQVENKYLVTIDMKIYISTATSTQNNMYSVLCLV